MPPRLRRRYAPAVIPDMPLQSHRRDDPRGGSRRWPWNAHVRVTGARHLPRHPRVPATRHGGRFRRQGWRTSRGQAQRARASARPRRAARKSPPSRCRGDVRRPPNHASRRPNCVRRRRWAVSRHARRCRTGNVCSMRAVGAWLSPSLLVRALAQWSSLHGAYHRPKRDDAQAAAARAVSVVRERGAGLRLLVG